MSAGRRMRVFFASRRRYTIFKCDWSSDVCSSDLRAAFDPSRTSADCGGTCDMLRSLALGGGAMRRREFIGLIGGVAAWPLAAQAQQPSGKVWRVAYLNPGTLDNPPDRALFDAFRAEMRELGYMEDKNLVIDNRNAEGNAERLPSLVSELIALRPNVIVAV